MPFPRQPGELEQADLSATTRAIRRVVMLAIPLYAFAVLAQPEYAVRWLTIVAATLGLCGATALLDRRGLIRTGSLVQALGLWVIITVCATTAGGVAALAPWFYVVFVLATGLCFGARAGAVAALFSVATSLFLMLLEFGGWFPNGALPYTPALRWLSLTLVLTLMAGLQWVAAGTINVARKRMIADISARETAEHRVRESEQRYRTLAETATDAIITIDAHSRILFANAAVERVFGYDPRELIGQPLTNLMPEHLRPAHETAIRHYLATGEAIAPWDSRELTGLSSDGRELALEVAFSDVQVGGEHMFTGIIRDVSERRRTEQALRSSERRFSIAFNANPTASTISTLDGLFLDANQQFLRTSGYSRDEVVGKTALELGMWRDPQDRAQLMQRLAAGEAVRDFEVEMWTKDNRRRVLLLSVERIELDGQPCFLHSGQDITERKLAENAVRASEARLRALSARLESAREEEGRRIAREIHDELGGTLTALKWDVEAVGKGLSWPMTEADAERIRQTVPIMLELVESTMTSVRRIAADLRPAVLDDLGVIAAIEWQVRQFQSRTGIRCDYQAGIDAPDLDRDRATAVFRILQEILTNVLRHARATHVSVEIKRESDAFVLAVKDNGRGIAQDELAAPRSLGLLGMRERALLAGGDVSIQGVPDGGTTVVVTIPIRELIPTAR